MIVNKTEKILQIKEVSVDFDLSGKTLRAVDNVSLDIYSGEIFGLVGESGSGKSTLATAILNLVSSPGQITHGEILYNGKDVLSLSDEELRKYRWKDVAMVFQAAQNAMNPVIRIRDQVLDTYYAHSKGAEKQILDKAAELMEYVRLDPDRVLNSYAHELSGGMKQRAIIALSLILDPKVLILDEPTTALDVITQAYIIEILQKIHKDLGITMIFLTHDVSIVAKVADRVGVMYAGQIVEVGSVRDIFYNPLHPYTYGLIHAAPSLIDDISNRRAIPGSPPDLINPPPGCRFNPRCDQCIGICREAHPSLVEVSEGHMVACLKYNEKVVNL
ncbi:peptide/nickel transport system ATP-binding protein [Caldanaerobius fijiensis DSM 17918]|uniref:Peptide/nickel transport system ATP-binding protein n=1 Tax=Caldanaerobius fijiensis DSM 17918 TaxID=1121256 RepID=A0A1M4XV69_9THEO|nr:ABC transporter ATP-binding protein [Caldanaerobius fijiensis]SHE97477.1 peptide/nickel transport system ATP-binding protein [Caldanaerobius fijiensis DSM 17918]